MTRTKLILAGLIAGALTFGTACKSDKAAEKEPADATMQPETMDPNQGGTPATPEAANPDTGGAGDMGTGTPPQDNGTGGSGDTGYEEDTSEFDDSQELGGNKFPSDDTVPRP